MTIVAGCSMLKGVMLVADTRATVLRPAGADVVAHPRYVVAPAAGS